MDLGSLPQQHYFPLNWRLHTQTQGCLDEEAASTVLKTIKCHDLPAPAFLAQIQSVVWACFHMNIPAIARYKHCTKIINRGKMGRHKVLLVPWVFTKRMTKDADRVVDEWSLVIRSSLVMKDWVVWVILPFKLSAKHTLYVLRVMTFYYICFLFVLLFTKRVLLTHIYWHSFCWKFVELHWMHSWNPSEKTGKPDSPEGLLLPS